MPDSKHSSTFEITCPHCKAELELDYKELQEHLCICPSCDAVITFLNTTYSNQLSNQTQILEVLTPEWAKEMNKKVRDLELRLNEFENKYPNTNLVSPKFWTRAWAVYGHQAAISSIFMAIFLLITWIVALS